MHREYAYYASKHMSNAMAERVGKLRVGKLRPSIRQKNRASSNLESFVPHGDLLHLAQCHPCYGILTEPVFPLCQPERNFWVFKAIVHKSARCRGFVGYG